MNIICKIETNFVKLEILIRNYYYQPEKVIAANQ